MTTKDIGEVEENICYSTKVYKTLWKEFGYDKFIESFGRSRKIEFDLNKVIFFQVLGRFLSPGSRLSLWNKQKRYNIDKEIPLHNIYRSLDIISDKKEKIECHTFKIYRNVFNYRVDVGFYYCMTFHFESVRSHEISNFGYSKSGNFNEVQVIMGLLIDKEGNPLGYNLFPDNLFPGNFSKSLTFVELLDSLKNRLMIGKIIFVADRALNSKRNIQLLQEHGYKYIVSSRIKNLPKAIKEEIFNKKGYNIQEIKSRERDIEIYKYKVIEKLEHRFKDEENSVKSFTNRLITTWSEKKRKYDEIEMGRMVEKARMKYQEKQIIQLK